MKRRNIRSFRINSSIRIIFAAFACIRRFASYSHRGFSLVELLIYTAVITIVVLTLSSTIVSFSRGRGLAEARTEVDTNLRFALEKIEADLRAASAVSNPPAPGSYSATLNPTWDITAYKISNTDGLCDAIDANYDCESSTSTTLKVSRTFPGCGQLETYFRSTMKFDLSTIPNNATVTDTDLTVNVNNAVSGNVELFRVTTDTPDTVSCTDSSVNLFNKLAENATPYVTATDWGTTGSKTHDLGTTADSDVQSRLSGTDLIALGVRHASDPVDLGAYNAVDNAANKPQLVVAYTIPSGTAAQSSVLTMTVGGSTITYDVSAGQLRRKVDSGSPESITPTTVTVSSLTFTRLENKNTVLTQTTVSIQTQVTMAYNSSSPDYQYSQSKTSTASLRI